MENEGSFFMPKGLITLAYTALAVFAALFLLRVILMVLATWKIFKKAGRAGWKALVPFWNIYELFDLSWKGLYGLLMIVCFFVSLQCFWFEYTACMVIGWILFAAAVYFKIAGLYKLSRAFGHGVGFTLGLIFFNLIFMMILGLGKSAYRKDGERVLDYAAEPAEAGPEAGFEAEARPAEAEQKDAQ